MADKKSFLLRLPPDLWEQLNRWSKDELRSVNGQIEYLLREALRKRLRIAKGCCCDFILRQKITGHQGKYIQTPRDFSAIDVTLVPVG